MATLPAFKSYLVIKTTFDCFHMWATAPDEYKYFRHPHRHKFYVVLKVRVTELNRALEFLHVQQQLDNVCRDLFGFTDYANHNRCSTRPYSCEQMAELIGKEIKRKYGYTVSSVEVYEDNENGGMIVFDDVAPVQEVNIKTKQIIHYDSKLDDKSKYPFYGIEAEGPFRGKVTLFVPCDATLQSVIDMNAYLSSRLEWPIVCETYEGPYIYFGAGDSTTLHYGTDHCFRYLLDRYKGVKLTIEVDKLSEILDYTNLLNYYSDNIDKLIIIFSHPIVNTFNIGANLKTKPLVFRKIRQSKGIVLSGQVNTSEEFSIKYDDRLYKLDKTLAQLKEGK